MRAAASSIPRGIAIANAAIESSAVTTAPSRNSATWWRSSVDSPVRRAGSVSIAGSDARPCCAASQRCQASRIRRSSPDAKILRDRAVDGPGEGRVVSAHADDVAALHRRRQALDPGERAPVALRDDVIEKHGVDARQLQVEVGLLLPLVEHRVEGTRLEELEGVRLIQSRDALPAKVVQRSIGRPSPDGEDLVVEEVRPREQQPGASFGSVLEAVEGDVEVAPLERGDQVRPLHLVEARPPEPELPGDRRGDVDLEPDDPRRVPGVLEDVGLTPLQIAAPYELSPIADGRQGVRARGTGASRRLRTRSRARRARA